MEEMLRNRTLQELDLSHIGIGATGIGYIAKGLRHNSGLVKLDITIVVLCGCHRRQWLTAGGHTEEEQDTTTTSTMAS